MNIHNEIIKYAEAKGETSWRVGIEATKAATEIEASMARGMGASSGEGGVLNEDDEQCPHDEHDHGICLDCGKDITDDLVAQAENASDARQDR